MQGSSSLTLLHLHVTPSHPIQSHATPTHHAAPPKHRTPTTHMYNPSSAAPLPPPPHTHTHREQEAGEGPVRRHTAVVPLRVRQPAVALTLLPYKCTALGAGHAVHTVAGIGGGGGGRGRWRGRGVRRGRRGSVLPLRGDSNSGGALGKHRVGAQEGHSFL